MARLRTSGDTSRATKALKSDAGVSAWASARGGGGGASAAGAAPSAAVGGAPAATEDGLGCDDEDAAGGNDGAGGGGSSTGLPSRTSCLRRDQRPRNPSAMTATSTTRFFSGHGCWVSKPVLQRAETVRPLAAFGFGLVVLGHKGGQRSEERR